MIGFKFVDFNNSVTCIPINPSEHEKDTGNTYYLLTSKTTYLLKHATKISKYSTFATV